MQRAKSRASLLKRFESFLADTANTGFAKLRTRSFESLIQGENMAKEILVGYGVDIDAVAGWLGS